MTYGEPSPRAVRAAHLAALTTLPSCLWRLALAAGFAMGYDAAWMAENATAAADRVALVALSLLTEGLALLTLGLVRPWGEVFPRWVPVVGRRAVPPRALTVSAGLGAVVLTLLWTPVPLMYTDAFHDPTEPQDWWQVLMATAYLPLVLWGPLLAVVAWDHHRRHRATPRPPVHRPTHP